MQSDIRWLSDMLLKDEQPVTPDTQGNREGIAEHSSSINGDVELPGRLCTVQAKEGRLTLGCVEGEFCLSRPPYPLLVAKMR